MAQPSPDTQPLLLEGQPLRDLLSPYLSQGLPNEEHHVTSMQIDGRSAIARCRVVTSWVSPTAPYHISFFNVAILVSQVSMIHGLHAEGYRAKDVEVWLTDFNMTCARAMKDPSDITIKTHIYGRNVTPPGKYRKNPRVFLRMRFEINDNWFGNRGLAFSLPVDASY